MERTQPTHPTFLTKLYLTKPHRVGMLFFVFSLILVALCFILGVANHYSLTLLSFIVSQPLAALVGGLIIARQPRNLVGWLIVGHSFFFTFPEFARQYAIYGIQTNPGSLPFAHAVTWFAYWMWGPGILFGFILLPLYFPNGKLVSPRWKYVVWYAILTSTLATLMMAFAAGDHETPGIPNPLGFLNITYVGSPYSDFAQASWMIGMILGVTSLLIRFYRADAQEKQQIKWIFYVMVLLLAFIMLPINGLVSEILGGFSIAGVWIAIGIAVLRFGLYDIDIIISRTVVYGTLTAVIVALYLLTAGVLGAFIPSGSNLFNALVAAGLVALIFQPLRERLQRSVNRLLYGERDEPYALLTRLGRRLEETIAPDQTLPTIVETVAVALKLPYAAIALGSEGHLVLAAEYVQPGWLDTRVDASSESPESITSLSTAVVPAPIARNHLVTIPLTHQRQILGELRLGLRPGEQNFGPADWRLLRELARQVSVAVSSAQLTHALQYAREQLIVAREEERRRLRRDLHDGLGPVLAAQRLKLGSARYFLQQDPLIADRLLAEQERDLDAALQEVRRLIDNLRPPVLDDLGLGAAIQRVAAQYGILGEGTPQGEALQIVVDVPGVSDVHEVLPPLPAAVEVACYRIVQEALNNVVRHAQARHCRVTLKVVERTGGAQGEHTLLLTVRDDGRGLEQTNSNGLGLHSMRARAEELGGTMSIGANLPKGTIVRVQFPISAMPERGDSPKLLSV